MEEDFCAGYTLICVFDALEYSWDITVMRLTVQEDRYKFVAFVYDVVREKPFLKANIRCVDNVCRMTMSK